MILRVVLTVLGAINRNMGESVCYLGSAMSASCLESYPIYAPYAPGRPGDRLLCCYRLPRLTVNDGADDIAARL